MSLHWRRRKLNVRVSIFLGRPLPNGLVRSRRRSVVGRHPKLVRVHVCARTIDRCVRLSQNCLLRTAYFLLSKDPRQVQKSRLPTRHQAVKGRMHLVVTGYPDCSRFAFEMRCIDSELFVPVPVA
jgi:hypothetical protein